MTKVFENDDDLSAFGAEPVVREPSPTVQLTKAGPARRKRIEETILLVDPNKCRPWRGHDRLYGHESDLAELQNDIKQNGQLIPAIGRRVADQRDAQTIEIICGMRRTEACRRLGQDLKVQLVAYGDREAAVAMFSENARRKDVTPMDRACSFLNQIHLGIFGSRDELSRAIGMSNGQLSKMCIAAEMLENPVVEGLFANKSMVPIGPMYRLSHLISQSGAKERLGGIVKDVLDLPNFAKLLPTQILRIVTDKMSSADLPALQRDYDMGTRKLKVTRDRRQRVSFYFPQGFGGLTQEQAIDIFRRALRDLNG